MPLDVFFDMRLNTPLSKQWGEADDLRRHHAHYDVIVMTNLVLLESSDFSNRRFEIYIMYDL